MLEDIIRPGILEMSSLPLPTIISGPEWSDFLVNKSLVMLAIFLFLLSFRDIVSLIPSLLDCIDRARANISLEHSLNVARQRNLVAIEAALPFCLVVDRYCLYSPDIMKLVPDKLGALSTIAAFLAYILVRKLAYLLFHPLRQSAEANNTIHHTPYNYFIVIVALLLATVGIMSVLHCSDELIKSVLLWETGVSFLYTLIRTSQILGYYCNFFTTFLYLCALELLPAGLLIASEIAL